MKEKDDAGIEDLQAIIDVIAIPEEDKEKIRELIKELTDEKNDERT